MKDRTPQEKKALSYAKDRRNDYGENDKSSRKNIPLRKAKQNRVFRKNSNQILRKTTAGIDAEKLEIIENEMRSLNKETWKKAPDAPLGIFVQRQIEFRARRAENGRTIRKKIRGILRTLEIEIEQKMENCWIATAKNFSNISGDGETPEKAVRSLKYCVHRAIVIATLSRKEI